MAKKNTNPFISSPDSLITQIICKKFIALYREKKKEEGWSQEDFANYIGAPLPYVKGILQRRYAPSHALIAQTSKLFKVSTDWIYGLSKGEV